MAGYCVELLSSHINKLTVDVNFEETAITQIEVNHSASVYEPKDETDPTILVKADCVIKDPSEELLKMTCETEFVFKFDPIPENRSAVAADYCPKIIHESIAKKAVAILNGMGHKLSLGESTTVSTVSVSEND